MTSNLRCVFGINRFPFWQSLCLSKEYPETKHFLQYSHRFVEEAKNNSTRRKFIILLLTDGVEKALVIIETGEEN